MLNWEEQCILNHSPCILNVINFAIYCFLYMLNLYFNNMSAVQQINFMSLYHLVFIFNLNSPYGKYVFINDCNLVFYLAKRNIFTTMLLAKGFSSRVQLILEYETTNWLQSWSKDHHCANLYLLNATLFRFSTKLTSGNRENICC